MFRVKVIRWEGEEEPVIDFEDAETVNKRPRVLTLREAARLQGFPEKFRHDAVSKKEFYKQMGNSVAVPVIEAVRDHLLISLANLGYFNNVHKTVKLRSGPPAQQRLGF